ncbi:nucleotide-diphospho-sugar transferase [Jimgerdemannia flammicorona]|uniref:Nucleotide-diphospho-sugar transferase n=1 Tax=Jimgerdemannia flammicorona TaxID=994334 RepID=A0A433Q6X2_9FUNG|nr:nucleotide-diphospho-sugar transferase [Jimgerdemannia flammicorona]
MVDFHTSIQTSFATFRFSIPRSPHSLFIVCHAQPSPSSPSPQIYIYIYYSFESGFFFRHPLLDEFDYYWRVEPSVEFFCDIDYDPFLYMQYTGKKYGEWCTAAVEGYIWMPSLFNRRYNNGHHANLLYFLEIYQRTPFSLFCHSSSSSRLDPLLKRVPVDDHDTLGYGEGVHPASPGRRAPKQYARLRQ